MSLEVPGTAVVAEHAAVHVHCHQVELVNGHQMAACQMEAVMEDLVAEKKS